ERAPRCVQVVLAVVLPAVFFFKQKTAYEVTDDEFEALLDQLHGTGKGPGSQPTAVPGVPATPVAGDEDLITDDEFESLLDELHGPGRGPGAATTPTPVSSPAPAAP